MLGAIFGDIVGSVYEFDNIKTKEFELFTKKSFFTDDTVMTVAVAHSLLKTDNASEDLDAFKKTLIKSMHKIGNHYPDAGYGNNFYEWLTRRKTTPYNSYGNGSAMRVSAVAWYANSLEEAEKIAAATAEVTHNHPEGIKGAVVTSGAAYLARTGSEKQEIKKYIEGYYDISFTVDGIRDEYYFNETCQETVPQALVCFLESTSFEDAIRNCISIGGDCDTTAAICGAVAHCYYGLTEDEKNKAISYLDRRLSKIVNAFNKKYVK